MQAILIVMSIALVNGYNINVKCSSYDNTNCLSCTPSYFLKRVSGQNNYCQACSNLIVGCLTCQQILSPASIASCTLCKQGYDKIGDITNGFYCVSCPQGMFYDYSITSPQCSTCKLIDGVTRFQNCNKCPQYQLNLLDKDSLLNPPFITPLITCKQCIDGLILNFNNQCIDNSTFNLTGYNTSSKNDNFILKQYLYHLLPTFKTPVTNFQQLSKVCKNNGFACQCNTINSTTSSRCTTFNSQLVKAVYDTFSSLSLSYDNIEIYNLAIQSVITDNTQTNTILDKLNTFIQGQPLSQKYIRIILQIVSKLDYNASYATLRTTINNLANIIDFSIFGIIDTTNTNGSIILTGNQYVFKISNYRGAQTITSKSNYLYEIINVVYDVSHIGKDFQYMIFNRSVYDQSFTGVLFENTLVSTPVPNQAKFKIPYINSLAYIGTYYINPIATTLNTTGVAISVSNGTFTFNLSGSINQNNIFTILSTQITIQQINADPHSRLRIQNLFYQSAVVYILVFLLLYMIFIPLCTFYDMCKDKKSKRHKKYVIPQRGTMEDITVTQQNIPPFQQKAEDNQINYKQFFPIYNITATQNRPERLLKLCLFLLNLQNPTTFLVILYVGVPALPVWAVLLAIPAYFLNIIFGYIYGFLKKRIPGRWKHSINIIPIGYWIIWYYLMQKLYVKDNFTLFVIIFTVVLIVIDIIIDALQCMIMYFIIKQQNPIYDCVAPILSYRGYFNYDKYRAV